MIASKELDNLTDDIFSPGTVPSFQDCSHFPAGIRASLNELLVHGILDPGFRSNSGRVPRLKPMANVDECRVRILRNGRPAAAAHRSLRTRSEHTIIIAEDGCQHPTQSITAGEAS